MAIQRGDPLQEERAEVGGAGVEGAISVYEGAYGGATSTEGELEVACNSPVPYRNNIPEEETAAAAGTGMESRRGEGSILVALLRGAGELRGSRSGELQEQLLGQPAVAAGMEAPAAGDGVEPKLQGRRLKHTSKRSAGGSAGERQLTALGLHEDVAAIKAAKKQHVDQHRPAASVPRRPDEMRSRGAMLLRMALDRMLQ